MMLKTPLATIYEESGSFIASSINNQQNFQESKIDHGLISARSIPTVDRQRQRIYSYQRKLPIEVRFRDGSKRYIHPSTTAKMLINRRNLLDSFKENSIDISHRSDINSEFQMKTNPLKRVPLAITIITADDLQQAGIISTSSSSTNSSDLLSITQSQINSPLHQLNSMEKLSRGSSRNNSIINTQSNQFINSSLQISSSSSTDENEKDFLLNSNQLFKQKNTSTVIQHTNSSAFHPIFKPIQFNQQTLTIKSQLPIKISRPIFNRTQQQMISYSQSKYKPSFFMSKDTSSNIPINFRTHPKLIDNIVNFSGRINYSSHQHSPMSWLNIIPNSIHNISDHSLKYWQISLPVVIEKHNQQNINLKKHLFNAGLSPETVVLYKQILNLADNRPKIIDFY